MEKERAVDSRFGRMVVNYFNDLYLMLYGLYDMMLPDGRGYIVVGDSAIYGVHIPTEKIISDIAKSIGYSTEILPFRDRFATLHNKKLTEYIVKIKKS